MLTLLRYTCPELVTGRIANPQFPPDTLAPDSKLISFLRVSGAAEDIFKDVSAYDKTIVEKVQFVDLLDDNEKKVPSPSLTAWLPNKK